MVFVSICTIFTVIKLDIIVLLGVVKTSQQPAHFTGYFEYCAGYSECVSRSVLSVILKK